MATILVTGASGFVGSYAVPALVGAGHRIVGLVRDEADREKALRRLTTEQRPSVEIRSGDVTRPETLSGAFAGVEAVLHLAAIPRDGDGGRSLAAVNTDGTRNMLRAARDASVRRFVHQGALGVVDDPRLHYASSKARAEALVRESGLDWTILKPSLLFGPRDGFFNIVADLVRVSPGIVPITGRGRSRFQPLAVDDLARILVLAFADAPTVGRTFELGGPAYWTYRQIVEEVLRGMGRRRLLLPVPIPLVTLVAGTAEVARLPFPVATDQLRQLAYDNVGPLDGVRQGFGFEPRSMAGALAYLRRRRRDQEVVPLDSPG
jgi:NADH dehydrogenase